MSCNVGYRAGSSRNNASRTFSVTCSSDCSYTPAPRCTKVSCGVLELARVKLRYQPRPYLPSGFDYQEASLEGDANFNTSLFPYFPPSSLPHVHGEAVHIHCAPGTRVSNMSACGASATSFHVPCWDGLYQQVTCPAAALPACVAPLRPFPHACAHFMTPHRCTRARHRSYKRPTQLSIVPLTAML